MTQNFSGGQQIVRVLLEFGREGRWDYCLMKGQIHCRHRIEDDWQPNITSVVRPPCRNKHSQMLARHSEWVHEYVYVLSRLPVWQLHDPTCPPPGRQLRVCAHILVRRPFPQPIRQPAILQANRLIVRCKLLTLRFDSMLTLFQRMPPVLRSL